MSTVHVCRAITGSESPWMLTILNVNLFSLLMCQFNYVNCACVQGGNGVCKSLDVDDPKCETYWAFLNPFNDNKGKG